MIGEHIIEIEILDEELGLLVAEDRVRDLDILLEDLYSLRGSHFISTLKEIAAHPSFFPVKDEQDIYSTGGESGDDYKRLLDAARKAVEHGYRVFLLPNPKGFRTADFIFERKGVYRMYDLKTIQGMNSIDTRLMESIGQTNRVILHLLVNYNPRLLAKNVKHYFERNADAVEVLIFKGGKSISIIREDIVGSAFVKNFMIKFTK